MSTKSKQINKETAWQVQRPELKTVGATVCIFFLWKHGISNKCISKKASAIIVFWKIVYKGREGADRPKIMTKNTKSEPLIDLN